MCHLAETASRLVLTTGMRVGGDLEQEQERKQTKSDRQWFGKSAQEWMRYSQHFCASLDVAFRVEPGPRKEQDPFQFN